MLIRNMNSVFRRHGRWLFGAVTILIAISFLGFLTPGFTGIFGGASRGGGAIGEIFGETITIEDVRTQNLRGLIALSLIYNRDLNDSMLESVAQQNAFPAAARMKVAKSRGISISDAEVANFIQKDANFQENGMFSPLKFQDYIDNKLKPLNLTGNDLDESIRDFLTQEALERIMVENIVTTPDEIANFNKLITEKIEIAVANFKSEDFTKDVKPTAEELENYFNANSGKYVIPVRFNATLAVFKYEPVKPTDEQIKTYFEDNKAKYAKDGKDAEFSAVKAQVEEDYIKRYSRENAIKAAQDFAGEIYDQIAEADSAKRQEIFGKHAARRKLTLIDTGWFESTAANIGELQEAELIREFSKIYSVPVTNAVPGKDAVYVGFLLGKEEARPAKLEEVKDRVNGELVQMRSMELARQAARDMVKNIAEAGDKDKVFKTVKDNKVFTVLPEFTMMMPPQVADSVYAVRLAESLAPGAFSPATDTPTGAIVVVMMKRSDASEKELQDNLQTAEYMFKQSKVGAARTAFSAWLQANLKEYRN